jgi:lipid II:glycine glycyltransferase (peptidoglycan interpeptide bridge formation enzyme)
MDLHTEKIDVFHDDRWDRFVMQHPLGTIYHHSCWQDIIQRTYGYEPFCFACTDGNSHIHAGIPFFYIDSWLTGRRFVSLPFSHFCDPLISSQSEFEQIFHALQNETISKRFSFFELRIMNLDKSYYPSDFKNQKLFKIHILKLNKDPEILRKSFHKSHIQRSIKKAEKSDIHLRKANDILDVKAFYKLQLKTRKKHGVPPQPFSFFINLWKVLYPKKRMDLYLVEHQRKTIAGMILLKFKNRVCYQYGASDENYLHFRPNHLLMWNAIKDACEEGFEYFDFGKSSVENEGLIEFKRRWGTEELDIMHLYYPEIYGLQTISRKSIKYKITNLFWGNTPSFITELGGKLLYKHLG